MIGHIVGGTVGYDEIGLIFTDKLNHHIALTDIASVGEQVADVKCYNLDACDFARALCFADSYFAKLLRGYELVSHISVCHVADSYLIASFYAFYKCARAGNFHIVGMTAYCKYIHFFVPFVIEYIEVFICFIIIE